MKEYEIWMEGYIATGESGTAQLIGTSLGTSFNDAVFNYMKTHDNHGITETGLSGYTDEQAYKNRKSNFRIWGCNLFDNESDARKSFG